MIPNTLHYPYVWCKSPWSRVIRIDFQLHLLKNRKKRKKRKPALYKGYFDEPKRQLYILNREFATSSSFSSNAWILAISNIMFLFIEATFFFSFFYTNAAYSCSISLSILYSRFFTSSDAVARGKFVSLCGLAHCLSSTAMLLVVCSDISNPGIISVPESVQPRKIFSQTIYKRIVYSVCSGFISPTRLDILDIDRYTRLDIVNLKATLLVDL